MVDASTLTNALTDDGPIGDSSRIELARDSHWAAPEQLLVETFAAVRGLHLGRKISVQRALDALEAMAAAHVELLPTKVLLPRMWELRTSLSGYDSAYVAAAESHGVPLVTADARLARSADLRCEIRLALPGQ